MFADPQRLWNPADLQHGAGAHPVFRIGRISAEDADFPGIGLQQPQEKFYGRGFSCSVWAQERYNLARPHPKIDGTQRPDISVILVYALEAGDHTIGGPNRHRFRIV